MTGAAVEPSWWWAGGCSFVLFKQSLLHHPLCAFSSIVDFVIRGFATIEVSQNLRHNIYKWCSSHHRTSCDLSISVYISNLGHNGCRKNHLVRASSTTHQAVAVNSGHGSLRAREIPSYLCTFRHTASIYTCDKGGYCLT